MSQTPFLLQLSGIPGTGKSTVASLLATTLRNTVVIDKDDDVKAVQFQSPETPTSELSAVAYQRTFQRARAELVKGRSVIIDSPSYRQVVADSGRDLADEMGATYLMAELRCTNRELLQRRLDQRPDRNYVANAVLDQPSATATGVVPLIIDTTVLSAEDATRVIRTYLGPILTNSRTGVQAVLFDYDGVVQLSHNNGIDVMQAAQDSGLTPDGIFDVAWDGTHVEGSTWRRSMVGEATAEDLYRERSAHLKRNGISLDAASYFESFTEGPINDACIESIIRLRDAGVRTALVCNTYDVAARQIDRRLDQIEAHHGPLFETRIYSCDVGIRKPDAAIFDRVLADMPGVRRDRACLIDDSATNVVGALRSGLQAMPVSGTGAPVFQALTRHAGFAAEQNLGSQGPSGR